MSNIYTAKIYEGGQKAFKGLNLINSFLFGASTEKPENAEFIAKLIIERATGRKVGKISVVPEKSLLGITIGNHGIRMDLYIEEYENEQMARVYDIEPNKYKTTELPMRSRYSQALTDVKLLGAGEKYRVLPEYISIWILPYDPFGQNRMLYTVKNCVVEDTRIVYNDGVKKLFLYVGGELGGNEELKNLLHYFSRSDEDNVVDPELSQLHSIVETIRGNQEMGERYMTLGDYIECEVEEAREIARAEGMAEGMAEGFAEGRAEGHAEGHAEGRAEGHAEGHAAARVEGIHILAEMLKELNIPNEQIVEKIIEKYQLSKEEAQAYLD